MTICKLLVHGWKGSYQEILKNNSSFLQVHVSSSPDPVAGMLACSDNMFVHNNSKHGRKSRKVESAYGRFLFKCDEIKEINQNINNMLSFISNHAKTLSVVIFMLQMLSVLSNIMLLIVLKYLFVFCSLSMYQGYLSQWGMDNWRNKCCSNRRKLFWWSTSGVWLTNCLEWGNIWFIWWDSKGWGILL